MDFRSFDIFRNVGDVVSRHVQLHQRLKVLNFWRQSLDFIVAETELSQSHQPEMYFF